jgi:hypothetical protein
VDQDRSETQEKMKYLPFLFLLFSTGIDSKKMSFFSRLNAIPKFVSTASEKSQWRSYTREYCFFEKELSYFLQYEFSPVPIPAFKIKAGIADVYFSVDIDPAHPIQFQKLREAWENFFTENKGEKICFEGAYLPASAPNDVPYIMIDLIKAKGAKLALKDYWMELE